MYSNRTSFSCSVALFLLNNGLRAKYCRKTTNFAHHNKYFYKKSAITMLSFDEFLKIDIRVGTILAAEPLLKARKPAFKLKIDFGEIIGIKQSSAQITDLYEVDTLVQTQIMAVVNFPPKKIAGFKSEVLVLGVSSEEGIVLLRPEKKVKNGERMH